jgi:hypothetical protein
MPLFENEMLCSMQSVAVKMILLWAVIPFSVLSLFRVVDKIVVSILRMNKFSSDTSTQHDAKQPKLRQSHEQLLPCNLKNYDRSEISDGIMNSTAYKRS